MKSCKECAQSISGDVLMANKSFYHAKCFTCDQCNERLSEQFTPVGDSVFCLKCYQAKHGLACSHCTKAITGKYFESKGKTVHKECLDQITQLSSNQGK